MALNFPNNPVLNDVYTVDQKTWSYTGTAWNIVSGNINASVTPSFTNIAVAGQTTVVADTATDTLTLVAGSGIAITTNAATDTVTLTSVASTGNITIVDTTLNVTNANPIIITPNLVLGGTLRFPDNSIQTTATVQGPAGPPGASGSGSGNVNSVLGNYVENALVRYSGTSGTTIKVSAASINDSGLLTAINFSGGGANITSLNATQLTSGTIPDARFPATLPAVSGANLTALNATNLGSGTVPVLRLGAAGTRDATTYLRGDNTWATVSGGAASDSFVTIAIAGQSSVVADSATDTLTLVAGTGITLTTDAGTDTVTITSTVSAGATAFTGLSDVNTASLTIDKIYLPAITQLAVTANGSSAYRFDQYSTTDNPTIYVISGTTIAFDLSVGLSSHPFLIRFSGANYNTGLVHVTTTGVVTTGTNAQGKTSGTLYWKIPAGISGDYGYLCSNHGGMIGTITVKDIAAI